LGCRDENASRTGGAAAWASPDDGASPAAWFDDRECHWLLAKLPFVAATVGRAVADGLVVPPPETDWYRLQTHCLGVVCAAP
jgi:hypothetical protein